MIKKYDNFSEENQLNENLLKNLWGEVQDYFRRHFGQDSWVYYAMYLQKNNKLDSSKVELICPPSYLDGVKGSKIPTVEDIEKDMKSRFNEIGDKIKNDEDEEEFESKVNEETITLDWPMDKSDEPVVGGKQEVMRNVDAKKLAERIERVYKMNLLRAGRHQKDEYKEDSKWERKKTHALFIWGAPGIGKTEILHQVAKKLDIFVQEWHLSQIEPTDFRGVPRAEKIGNKHGNWRDERTVSKLPSIFPTSDGNGKGGIMFFDELNRADQLVLSASLALALSGKHGDYRLPPRWIVLAAGNRPSDLSDPSMVVDDSILWNRFAHINYSPTVDAWAKWATDQKQINPDLIAFLMFHKHMFHRKDSESKTPAYPTPRTWEMASIREYFKRNENWDNKLSNQEISKIYQGYVGLKAAADFVSYLKLKSHFSEKDIEDVYKKGAAAKKMPSGSEAGADVTRAIAIAVAYFKNGQKLTLEEFKNIIAWEKEIPNYEVQMMVASSLKVVHPYIVEGEYKETYFENVKYLTQKAKGE